MKIQSPVQDPNIFLDLCRLTSFVLLPLPITAALLLVWVLGGSPLTAQSQTSVSRAQPVLHVQATIIPVVVVPDDHAAKWQSFTTDFDVLSSDAPLSVTEELDSISVKDEHEAVEKGVLLRTTTIVPK